MPASWTCPTCSKIFSRKADFIRHQNLHTGYKPHSCPDCGKRFSQHSGLKTHLNVHTKAKPFKCGILDCKAAFGDPSSCARHRKETHCMIGAYKCPAPNCKSRIKRRSAFVAHLGRKHQLDADQIDIDAIGPTVIRPNLPMERPAERTTDRNPVNFGQFPSVSPDNDSDKVSTFSHSSRTSDTSLDLLMNFANETLYQAPLFAYPSGATQPPQLPDVPLYTLPATPRPLSHLEYSFSPSVLDEDRPATTNPSDQRNFKNVHIAPLSKMPVPSSPFTGQFVPGEKVQQWDWDSLYWTTPFQGINF